MSERDKIINSAEMLFMKYGIRSVSMDELARELGISKKTIYKNFSDKHEIVESVVDQHMNNHKCEIDDTIKNADNAVHEMFLISIKLREMLAEMNPSILYDIKKYHPGAWEKFQEHKHSQIIGMLRNNLERGIKEGLYRKSIDVEIISILRMEEAQLAFEPKFRGLNKSLTDVQLAFFDHYVHGIVSLKGHKLLNKYQHITEEE